LFTVMVGRIISSGTNTSEHQEIIKRDLKQYKGSIVEYTSKTFIATFEGPSKAVFCGSDLVKAMRAINAPLSLG
ncbi:hypothetical protein, partial [uncultured Aquimarina sp.]|uniref:hypothetical protein n=1 Tax=uncultured Aquimarina sp. TaxID=575652 RepID=UPI002631F06B